MSTETTAFPLCWPAGKQRTPSWHRTHARFDTAFAKARDNTLREVARLGGSRAIISANIPLRNDGLPFANRHVVNGDTGIAVYFTRKGKQLCFACDAYLTVDDNMHAIGKTIEALRGISRWGTGDMMEAAFTGFAALPAPSGESCWNILGVPVNSTEKQIMDAYYAKAQVTHPDKGGTAEAFDALAKAKDLALSTVRNNSR